MVRYWDELPPQGISIPRKRKAKPTILQDEPPFVHPVRAPLYPYTPWNGQAPYTPWTPNLQTLPASPGDTLVWPPNIYMPSTPYYPNTPLLTPGVYNQNIWFHRYPPVPPRSAPHIWPPDLAVQPMRSRDNTFDPRFPGFFKPGTFPMVPWGTEVPVVLHPHLIYNPMDWSIPSLRWDINHHPDIAKRYTGRHLFVTPDLSELATEPGLSTIVIGSDHLVLAQWMQVWGRIRVNKANASVRDLLVAIWEYMHVMLTQEDFNRLKAAGQESLLGHSARERIRSGHEIEAVALKRGYKRIDVLGTNRRFLGLRAEVHANGRCNIFMGLTSTAM